MSRVLCVSVQLASSDHPQVVWRASGKVHLLVHTQVLVDLGEAASGQDLDRVEVAVLGLPDCLRRDPHRTQLVAQLPVFSQ